MKRIISLAAIALLFNCQAAGQTKSNATIYGYVQDVSGGAAPDRSQLPDKQTNPGGKNIYVYLADKTGSRIYPSEMWIEGEQYGVQLKIIAKTPIVLESQDFLQNQNRELVPETTDNVVQLIPISSNGVKNSAKAKSLSTTNELVVVYKQAGKFYYATLAQLTKLENTALQ